MESDIVTKIDIIKNSLKKSVTNSNYKAAVFGSVDYEAYKNACGTYATEVEYGNVLGQIDESNDGNGSKGMLFTADGFYYTEGENSYFKKYKDYDNGFVSREGYNISVLNNMLKELSECEKEESLSDSFKKAETVLNDLSGLIDNLKEGLKAGEKIWNSISKAMKSSK